jgi:hypothetical protein
VKQIGGGLVLFFIKGILEYRCDYLPARSVYLVMCQLFIANFIMQTRIGPSDLDSYRGSNVKLDKKESIIIQG